MKKIRIIIFILIFVCIFFLWNKVITIGRSLSTDVDLPVDYVLLGSSHMYHGVNPLEIWNQTGYTGYNLGSDLQIPETSYFSLKEYLDKGNIPNVVFLDFFGFMLEGGDASYNLVTASQYPLTIDKINYINSLKSEERITQVFPFLQFHSRWNKLVKNDYNLEKNNGIYNFMGYLPFITVYENNPDKFYPEGKMSPDYIPNQDLLNDFEKIYNLCEEYNIELVLIKTPTPDWSRIIHTLVKQNFADRYGVEFIDFNAFYKEIGFDVEKDFADQYHLNVSGSEKISKYIAEYLKKNYSLEDKRSSEEAEFWDNKYQDYLHYLNTYKAATQQEMDEYLSAFTNENYLILITTKNHDEVQIKASVDGEIIAEKTSNQKVSKSFEFDNRKFYIESTKEKDKQASKIQVDFQNYSLNENNINIVVYDLVFDVVVSTKSF